MLDFENKLPCFLTLYEAKKNSQQDLLEGQEELEQQRISSTPFSTGSHNAACPH